MEAATVEEKARTLPKEITEKGNLDLIDEHFADDYVGQITGVPEPYGRDEFKEVVTMFRTAFPDIELTTVEEVIAEGDKVARRDRWTGTHEGELMGIEPTGKEVEFELTDFIRFDEAGRVVEERALFDMMGLMQQLGVVEAPGE